MRESGSLLTQKDIVAKTRSSAEDRKVCPEPTEGERHPSRALLFPGCAPEPLRIKPGNPGGGGRVNDDAIAIHQKVQTVMSRQGIDEPIMPEGRAQVFVARSAGLLGKAAETDL